ncbi:CpsD/CapB family tyrosine-protein kinase [Clostridium sp. SM-530-WT-3G]|uniref:CpsD/CapB family tyrosine-protein kinase n=1 Tax=Clostridium sp. SM-530-WT-3G TaxID=2725303 RepID=UPI00145E8FE6|nr:CpsD/CapB family tyrosine-protein kinase [Clostridium sp. SM-530-WT-3G]NME82456.1 CpsD/CapB family tyrosine-protein kinase [Clostridium sp. SM-530-WT-3G]
MFVIEKKPKSFVSEAYRTLRTNIQYSSFDKKLKTILVTSSDSNEGKSTISGNLALAFAQSDKRVLLIDCDLRSPSIHKMFKISNIYGLSEVLLGTKRIGEMIKSYNNKIDILPSGNLPPNPSELLGSEAFENLIEQLKESYDLIILDSAPVRVVSDSQLLAAKADGTILVVKKDKTKINYIKESKNLLKNVGANIIGCVLNYNDKPGRKNKEYYVNEEVSAN